MGGGVHHPDKCVHPWSSSTYVLIDIGAQPSLVNSAVINSLNLSSQPININMSTCGSSDSNNIKGLICLDLRTHLQGRNYLGNHLFSKQNTNEYPLIIGANIIFNHHDTIITDDRMI